MNELRAQRSSLMADLYQKCGQMTVRSLEELCRKINCIELKIHSFKRGTHGDNQQTEGKLYGL